MGNRRALVLLLSVALGAGACGAERPAPRADAPNVLLISIDTLRSDRVGAYGAKFGATPTIDALAAEGVRCEKAMSPAPITLPAHATLFTGLYPPRHGVRHNGIFRLAAERTTLAERFHDAGYATGAVVGSVVLERRYGLDQGFDRYDDRFAGSQANVTGYLERSAADVTASALRWLGETEGPFFLFAHYYDPHAAYVPPAPWSERFAGAPYEGEIASVDAALGALLDGLRAQGRLDRTIVVVTSDHGESLGEHGERTHSYGLYDATLSIPLVLRGPGVPAGKTVPGVVTLASVAPTLLALAGLPALPATDGEDLVARLAAPARAGEAYAETLATQLDHGWAPLHALRTPAHHYVRAPRSELYDVAEDPRELANRFPRAAAAEIAALDGPIDALLAQAVPLRRSAVDAATLRDLRALGYAVQEGEKEATGLDPKDGLRLVEIHFAARSALAMGDLGSAERLARQILAESPRSANAHLVLVDVARARGDLRTALAEAQIAARLVPESAANATLVGDLRLESGDLPGADEAYRAALAIDPAHAEALAGSMWRAVIAEDPAVAEEAARAARAARPDDPAIAQRVAETWDRMSRADLALAAYEDALRLAPSERAEMGAAIQLVRLGRADEAEAHLVKAGAYTQEPNARNRLAIAYAGRGDTARAEAIFRELLAAHPKHANTRRNLARLLRDTGRGIEAAGLESASR